MKNVKRTKRALLYSGLALVVCISMLIGSTFAWFTDNVTTAGTTIQSGKLDVDLVDDAGISLEGKVLQFVDQDNNALWEPGCTYNLQNMYVVNNGNLALKYELAINGIDGDAKLLEVIDWTVTVGGVTTAVDSLKGFLLAGAKTDAIVLSGHMKEEAGNEYQDLTVEGISVSLYATQYTFEGDSFGFDYDQGAIYADSYVTSAAELADAVAQGGTVALMGDIDLADLASAYSRTANPNTVTIPKGVETVINLNGYNITGESSKDSGNQAGITVKGSLAIVGGGSIVYNHTGANMEWNALSAVISVEGGTLSLGAGVNIIHNGGTDMAYAVDVNSTLGETVLNIYGANLKSSYIAVRLFNNHKTAKAIVNLVDGYVDGGSRDIWVHNPSANAVDANGVVNIADTYDYDMTVQDFNSSRIYQFSVSIATNADNLKDALAADKDVIFNSDVTVVAGTQPDRNNYVEAYGNAVGIAQYGNVIDGQGNALTVTDKYSYVIVTHGGTIKNLKIVTGGRGIVIYAPTEDVSIDNVVIDGPGYAINTAEHNGKNLIVTNSTINGWTSLAGLDSVTFENCSLGANTTKYWQNMGYNQDYDRLIRPYGSATFKNCVFSQGYYFDLSALAANGTVTIEGCTVNGVKLTADNYSNYVTVELPSGRTVADCVIFK